MCCVVFTIPFLQGANIPRDATGVIHNKYSIFLNELFIVQSFHAYHFPLGACLYDF